MKTMKMHTDQTAAMLQDLGSLRLAFDAAVRESDWLRQELITARQREADDRDQLAWFRRRLEDTEQRLAQLHQGKGVGSPLTVDRASPLTTDNQPLATSPRTPTARRQCIGTWMQRHPGPHTRQAIEQALGLTSLRDTLRHMVESGHLVKVGIGLYQGRDQSA